MAVAEILNNDDWLGFEREYCRRSLVNFIRQAWHVLEPATPFIHGWHLDAKAEHLTAVTNSEINRLLINEPPGMMKSLMSAVFWPAWEWGPLGLAHHRVIGAAYEEGLATRDNLKMRRLVRSEWFQTLWPLAMTGDQNAKTYFENEKTGFRQSCPVKSMTGKRGHRVIWDDPHNIEGGLSIADRVTTLRVFQETLPSRMVDPERSAIVIDMQRIHEGDVSGHIIESDLGYTHLCLPMEFEPERRCTTSIGFRDPRTKEGELLFPARFPRSVVERDKKVMGAMATAGQFQQRPAPRSGAFFEWEKLEVVEAAPARFLKRVRYWDKAGTEGGGAFTAGVLMSKADDGYWYVEDVVRGQWSAAKREKTIKTTAQLDGVGVKVWIEQEPGSGGKESAERTIENLSGFHVEAERATGAKELRAEPYAVQVEAGNIRVLNRPWTKEFVGEHKTFPVGKYKDQIDAASGAFSKVAGTVIDYSKLI